MGAPGKSFVEKIKIQKQQTSYQRSSRKEEKDLVASWAVAAIQRRDNNEKAGRNESDRSCRDHTKQ